MPFWIQTCGSLFGSNLVTSCRSWLLFLVVSVRSILLLLVLSCLLPSCNRNDGLQQAEFEEIMRSKQLTAKKLFARLIEYYSKYKIYENQRGFLEAIKKESSRSLSKYKDKLIPNAVFHLGENSDQISYIFTVTTVTDSIGDTISATQHNYNVVFFDGEFNVIGWVVEK